MFCLAVFLFPVIKRGKKKEVLFFSVTGEGKCDLNHEKKGIFFSPLGSFFYHFGREFAEKMIRKFFGGKEKK